MKKKMISILSSIMLTVISVIMFSGCYYERANDYTEEEHITRVTKLAKQRYIDNGEYTSLEVFPLYDENDELGYFLIELEPAGYVYVKLNVRATKHIGLYIRKEMFERPWFHHIYEYGKEINIVVDGKELWYKDMRPLDGIEMTDLILFYSSPFAVSGICREKLYLLNCSSHNKIPAVKKDGVYINLISMENFKFNANEYHNVLDYTTEFVSFIYAPSFIL